MTEIVASYIDGYWFNHIVDVEHEDEFVQKELSSICKTKEEIEDFVLSLKDDEVWPCRLGKILDAAKENGVKLIDFLNFLFDKLGEWDKGTCLSYIGATGKKINNILKNAKQIRVVFTSDEENYELESWDFSIVKVIRYHCAGEGGSFCLRKIS